MEGETAPITIEPTATPATATEAPPSSIPDASGDTNAASATSESASAGTTSDEDKKPDDEDSTSKESERKAILDQEVAQVGDTLENSMANAFGEQLTAAGADEREQLMSKNPGLQLLRTRQGAKSATQIPPGQIHLLTGDQTGVRARYKTQDGDSIIGIIHANTRDTATPDTHMLTLRVINDGNPEDVRMTRAELLDLMYQTDKTLILESYPPEDRPLMEKYYAGLSGKEKEDDHYQDLPELITQVAEAHGITTTDTLRRAGETYFKAQEIPAGATPEEIAQINEENKQKAALLEALKQKLAGKNLATTEDKKNVMSLIGLDRNGITATLERARTGISTLRQMIDQASTPEAKKQLQARLDTAQATVKIYEEVQSKITDTTVEDFEASQQAGGGSVDLRKQINQAIEENDIVALVLMTSPEASVTATAAEITKAREAREKYNRNLKTIGVVAALAALLLALGISQGAKQ